MIEPGRAGADVLIANYHAPQETNVDDAVAVLKGMGVENVRMQRDVLDVDLYFKLLSIASIGDLHRMTQYKAAAEDARTAQMLTYPVLMAADVAGYDEVVVGDDQEQHIEFARKLLKKYNKTFKKNVKIPTAAVVSGRVMDLRDPTKKMSKSSPAGCLFLDDSRETIAKKIRKATTDEDGLTNLHFLYRKFVGEQIPERNDELKTQLAAAIADAFGV